MATATIAIELSQEEVWYLLRALKLKGVPGFDVLDEDMFNDDVLISAENSLLARGLIERELNLAERVSTIGVTRTATALVGAGAIARQTLMLEYEPTSNAGRIRTWFYFAPELIVMHAQPEPTSHRFIAIPDGEMLFNTIATTLHLNTERHDLPFDAPIGIATDDFVMARDAASYDDALVILQNDLGMPADEAKPIAAAMHHKAAIGRVLFANLSEEKTDGFVFLTGEQTGFWMIDGDNNVAQIQPVLPTAITARILDYVKQYS